MRVVKICCFAAGYATCFGGYAESPKEGGPVKIILDTDMGNDVDDALALAMLHALESRGECELLAVAVSKGHPLAAAFVSSINCFYGRSDIPVALVSNGVTPEVGKFLELATIHDGDQLRYPIPDSRGSPTPDAVAVLRATIAAQPTDSIVIVQVGFSTNLARLLRSGPDASSSLRGRELVSEKIKRLVVMAGCFASPDTHPASDPEYNVEKDVASAQMLVDEWPSPIEFCGFEVGLAIEYPAESILQDYCYVKHHPIAEAYKLYSPPPHNRPTWDLTAVLQAVHSSDQYFHLSPPGRVTIDSVGHTRFHEERGGPHRYLKVNAQQSVRAGEAFKWLASQPPVKPPHALKEPIKESP